MRWSALASASLTAFSSAASAASVRLESRLTASRRSASWLLREVPLTPLRALEATTWTDCSLMLPDQPGVCRRDDTAGGDRQRGDAHQDGRGRQDPEE